MANTVTALSYANTFGDWVITTNNLATEINSLGKSNYTKDSGLFNINSPQGLQVSNNALFTSGVNLTGLGTPLTITAGASIGGSLNVTNIITTSNVVTNNATINNINSNITINGSTVITGNLTVSGNTNLTFENVSMDEVVTGNLIIGGTISGNGATAFATSILSSALALSIALG
jgi:hypothetical protein